MVVCVDLVFVNLIPSLNRLIHALEIHKLVKVPSISLLKRVSVLFGSFSNRCLHITLRCMIQQKVLLRLPISIEIHTCLFKFHKVPQQFWLPLELFFSCVFELFQLFLLFFHLVDGLFEELLVYREGFFKSSNLLMSYVVINVRKINLILLKNRHWFQLWHFF